MKLWILIFTFTRDHSVMNLVQIMHREHSSSLKSCDCEVITIRNFMQISESPFHLFVQIVRFTRALLFTQNLFAKEESKSSTETSSMEKSFIEPVQWLPFHEILDLHWIESFSFKKKLTISQAFYQSQLSISNLIYLNKSWKVLSWWKWFSRLSLLPLCLRLPANPKSLHRQSWKSSPLQCTMQLSFTKTVN